MKRLLIVPVMVALAALSFGMGAASEYLSADASWWAGVPGDAKLPIVIGAMDAYQTGWLAGAWYAAGQAHDEGAGERAVKRGYPSFAHSFGYYEAAITDFYATHPSSSDVTIGKMMECLQDSTWFSCDGKLKLPDR